MTYMLVILALVIGAYLVCRKKGYHGTDLLAFLLNLLFFPAAWLRVSLLGRVADVEAEIAGIDLADAAFKEILASKMAGAVKPERGHLERYAPEEQNRIWGRVIFPHAVSIALAVREGDRLVLGSAVSGTDAYTGKRTVMGSRVHLIKGPDGGLYTYFQAIDTVH